ncbi:hypothetical protein [Streptomyces sp. NPDC001292]|uniref:hypothetical protein n=1 Tax=Streptomyces sp. NPDC001292 TaxID=3364558 RepID=UPI0036C301DC
MPDQMPSDHFASGRLLAALWTLRLLGGDGGTPPEQDGFLAKKVPAALLREELGSLTDHLFAAKSRGGDRWEAAVKVFREIPDLLPSKKLPSTTMGPDEQTAFAKGYAKQRSLHAKEFGRLLET